MYHILYDRNLMEINIIGLICMVLNDQLTMLMLHMVTN